MCEYMYACVCVRTNMCVRVHAHTFTHLYTIRQVIFEVMEQRES